MTEKKGKEKQRGRERDGGEHRRERKRERGEKEGGGVVRGYFPKNVFYNVQENEK